MTLVFIFQVISEELFRNMAFNLMVVFIVTLVVLANLRACLMVFSCVGFTLVSYPTSTKWNKLFDDRWVRASDIMRWRDLTSPGGRGYARKFYAGRPRGPTFLSLSYSF